MAESKPAIRAAARLAVVGVLALAGAACAANPAASDGEVYSSQEHEFRLEVLQDGLEHPWSFAFLPNGDMLVTERPGDLRLIADGTLREQPLAGVPEVAEVGQGGLMDVVLHPEFEENRLIYLSYSKSGTEGYTTALARARFDGEALSDVEEIFVADAWAQGGRHFGSRIVFDREGYLYLSVGERGQQDPAQDLGNHMGTVLRLNDDGSVPDDNPFVDDPDALDEIYSYGHRNPQGMVVHPETGAVWLNEHGPRGGGEINVVEPGLNYGWPVITYGVAYSGQPMGEGSAKEGMEQPLLYWVPSIAPSGMMIYDGEAFPEWQGDVFNGALAKRHLRRVVFDGLEPVEEEELLVSFGERIRAVQQGPDDLIYILTDADNGALARLVPVE